MAELTASRLRAPELEDEVVMEVELPYFVEPEDVRVRINDTGVQIECSSADSCNIKRTFWRDR